MYRNTIERIEKRIQSGKVSPENQEKVLALLEKLKADLEILSKSNQEAALNVAELTESTSLLAISRQTEQERAFQSSLDALHYAVQMFDTTHPALVSTINQLCVMLSGIGI